MTAACSRDTLYASRLIACQEEPPGCRVQRKMFLCEITNSPNIERQHLAGVGTTDLKLRTLPDLKTITGCIIPKPDRPGQSFCSAEAGVEARCCVA